MTNGTEVKNIVVIASSTGGPKSLQKVISELPKNLNAAVIVIQHMPSGFTNSLAKRLDEISQIHVKEAEAGETISNGVVYVAKGGQHLLLDNKGQHTYQIQFCDEPPREGVKPCANYIFESISSLSFSHIVCVVMTGMGSDGTVGIRTLKKSKEIYTIAQNEETCVIYGMPKTIVEAKLADVVLPLQQIHNEITKKVGVLQHGY